MGWRFKKSFKIAPDSKANLNKGKKGCLFYLLALLVICVCLMFFPLLWIPAIGFIIFFAIKKDTRGTKIRNILISVAVLVLSFIALVNFDTSDSLSAIHADWEKNTYDVSETAEVKITPTPSDAEITSLELSDNSIAELDYSNGKAIITFKNAGDISLFFTANGNINSNTESITVTDKAAEEAQRKAEEEKATLEAQKKAEEEAKAAAEAQRKAEEEAKAAEEAQKKAEKEAAEKAAAEKAQAEKEAAEKARAEKEAAEKAQAEKEAAKQAEAQSQQNAGSTVYWTPNGKVYHSTPDCPSLARSKTILSGTIEESGKPRPCKNCY